MDTTKMRTWAEIDLSALEHNYRALRAMLPAGCRFLGVCKANAYGQGGVPVAKKLEELGADMLAVACVDEARELRENGVTLPILCLGNTPVELAPMLLEYRVTQAVGDLATGQALSDAAVAAGKTLTIHVKLDTGMSRLGFLWQGEQTAREIARLCALPGLEAEGMFTHFADADSSEEYTMAQLTKFLDAKEALEKLGVSPVGEAGEEFNPEIHNAVAHIEDETVAENTIVEVFQKGYMLKEKVIRHAMVKVAN